MNFFLKKHFLIIILAITILSLSVFFALKDEAFVKITDVKMTDNSGNFTGASVNLPLNKESISSDKEYTFIGKINYTRFAPKSIHITPDDCVENIFINEKNVSLGEIKGGRCDWNNGFDIDLSGYLNYGENNISIKVKDYGGKFGLSVGNSADDPVFIFMLVLVILFCLPVVYFFLKRVLKIKKTDNAIFLSVMVIFAIAIRYCLFDFQSGDYGGFISKWYEFIKTNGGYKALSHNFSDYNPPYLYLLALFSYLPVGSLYAVKIISVSFDFIAAFFMFKLVKRKYENETVSVFSFIAVLFAPTVVLNGSYWGQSDIIYSAFLLASIYFLSKGKNALSFIMYGISISFKIQAIFLFPIYIIFFLKKKLHFACFFIIPAVFFISVLPSVIIGRPWMDAFSIYLFQVKNYSSLTLNAPTIYQWFSQADFLTFSRAGILFSASAICAFVFIAYKKRKEINGDHIIKISFALLSALPFFLPRMHERYFFPADIFSIVYAFYFPRYFFVPIGMQVISFFSYGPFLFGSSPNFKVLSFGMFAIILIVLTDLFLDLYRQKRNVII